jgi:hypothetical protein
LFEGQAQLIAVLRFGDGLDGRLAVRQEDKFGSPQGEVYRLCNSLKCPDDCFDFCVEGAEAGFHRVRFLIENAVETIARVAAVVLRAVSEDVYPLLQKVVLL